MIKWLVEEFKRGPAATLAAYVAILSAAALLLSATTIQLPRSTNGAQLANAVPVTLLLIGVFAFALSYGSAYLLNFIRAVTARYFASMVTAILVQCATAALTRSLLNEYFDVRASDYERSVTGVLQQTAPAVARVAGVDLNSFVFVVSALVALIFVGATLGKWENEESDPSKETDIAFVCFAGVVWAAIVIVVGGGVMETLLRAGL